MSKANAIVVTEPQKLITRELDVEDVKTIVKNEIEASHGYQIIDLTSYGSFDKTTHAQKELTIKPNEITKDILIVKLLFQDSGVFVTQLYKQGTSPLTMYKGIINVGEDASDLQELLFLLDTENDIVLAIVQSATE